MTEPAPSTPAPTKKARKPKPPATVKGKIDLAEFRDLLERCVNHRDILSDAQVRFVQTMLQAIHQDASGVIRVTLSPLPATPRAPKRKFSMRAIHIQSAPGDEDIRTVTREIALLTDETVAFERIDALPVEFLHRAAALFGFKAETLVGLKSAFAGVVADIRQMENIAASRPKSPEAPKEDRPTIPDEMRSNSTSSHDGIPQTPGQK